MAAMMPVETWLAETQTTGVAIDRRQMLWIAGALHCGNRQMPAQRLEHELHAVLAPNLGAELFGARFHLRPRAGRECLRQPLGGQRGDRDRRGPGTRVEHHLAPEELIAEEWHDDGRQPSAQACGRRPG